jgi:beta-lactamase superfamily II metal-dependent hydrolase
VVPRETLPSEDEFEVSVFGPGVGESVVIHTTGGRWVIIDACQDRSGDIAPLVYLRQLGLDPAECVDWVIATHAHDDHVSGLAQVVTECANAEVVLPAASDAVEFLAISEIDKKLSFYQTRWTVYREYERVFAEVKKPGRSVHYASAGTVLPFGVGNQPEPILKLSFLAPSGHAVGLSKRAFGHLLKVASEAPGGRVSSRDPNTFSIALLVTIGDFSVLLGGDVRCGTRQWGWRHIVAHYPVDRPAIVHKVPHHGSMNAYEAQIWDQWLDESCVNVIAPYRPSRLPRDEAVAHMTTHGMPIWATARSGELAASAAVKKTRTMTRDVATRIEEGGGVMGRVRLRQRPGGSPTISTSGPAFRLV